VNHIEVPASIEVGHIKVHRDEGHWFADPEWRQRSKDRRKGEALHGRSSFVSLPASQETAVVKHVLRQRVQRPEVALSRVPRLAGHLYEAIVQAEIVPDRVLPGGELVLVVWKAEIEFDKCFRANTFLLQKHFATVKVFLRV